MSRQLSTLSILFFSWLASSDASPRIDSTKIILKNILIVDVEKGRIVPDRIIVIKKGKIIKITKRTTDTSDALILDLNGAFVPPGLIDTHVHLSAPQNNNINTTYNHLRYLITHGITSVRDVGGDGKALLNAKNKIQNGKGIGPDIYFSAFMAGDWYFNRGQHLRKSPYSPWEQRVVPGDNLDEAMQAARQCGATGIKLYHSFDAVFLKKIARKAKKHGLKVWGHSMMYPAKPIEVIQAGVEVLSHVSMLEVMRTSTDNLFYRRNRPVNYRDSVIANLDIKEFCKQMKAHSAILDATLCVSVEKDPWVLPLLKRIHKQNVEISAGTDQIVDLNRTYPYLIDELIYFTQDCGFTNAEAIRAATITAAKVIGREKFLGIIKKGRNADLIVTNENPLSNVFALKKIDMVIKAGKIIKAH
jgi:imidazolonepropionase-like amidohydrolase